MKNDVNSVLSMDKLVFDKIEFKRMGLKNDNEIEFNLQIVVDENIKEKLYKVTLELTGNKEKEYSLEIILSGYFSFETNEELDESFMKKMISQNAVAIVMPYLRSEVSLLTAQPDVDCVVLPPFNVANMMTENKRTDLND